MTSISSNMLGSLYSALPLPTLYPLPGVTSLTLMPLVCKLLSKHSSNVGRLPQTPQVDSGTLPLPSSCMWTRHRYTVHRATLPLLYRSPTRCHSPWWRGPWLSLFLSPWPTSEPGILVCGMNIAFNCRHLPYLLLVPEKFPTSFLAYTTPL